MAKLIKRTASVFPYTMGGFTETEVIHEYDNGRMVHFLQRAYSDSPIRVLHVTNLGEYSLIFGTTGERRYYYRSASGQLTTNDHYGADN